MRARRSPTRNLQQALKCARGEFHRPPPHRRGEAARVRGAARCRARHQEPHARASRPLPRGLRGAGRRRPAARCTGRATAEEARQIVLDICRDGRRPHRHQGQVDDRRGDRPQRLPRGERHHAGRDRPRRIHHPAARRDALPHHRAGGAPDQGPGRGGLPPRAHASAGRPQPGRADRRCSPRRAACCARSSSPPMSASPAPTSWSPRPAPR